MLEPLPLSLARPHLAVLNIKEILNEESVRGRGPAPARHIAAESPHMVCIVHAVTQLQEAGAALARALVVVQVELLEVGSDEVSVLGHHLPPGEISSENISDLE